MACSSRPEAFSQGDRHQVMLSASRLPGVSPARVTISLSAQARRAVQGHDSALDQIAVFSDQRHHIGYRTDGYQVHLFSDLVFFAQTGHQGLHDFIGYSHAGQLVERILGTLPVWD